MIAENTERGFARLVFNDRYGVVCSLQESSLATEGAIWFGPSEANTRHCVPGEGWVPFEYPAGIDVLHDTRMHLTQGQVKRLLPMLNHFVKTSYLPEIEDGFFMTQEYRWKLALEEIHGWRKIGWMVFAVMVGGIFGMLTNIGIMQ
jgi:hypothetical protein